MSARLEAAGSTARPLLLLREPAEGIRGRGPRDGRRARVRAARRRGPTSWSRLPAGRARAARHRRGRALGPEPAPCRCSSRGREKFGPRRAAGLRPPRARRDGPQSITGAGTARRTRSASPSSTSSRVGPLSRRSWRAPRARARPRRVAREDEPRLDGPRGARERRGLGARDGPGRRATASPRDDPAVPDVRGRRRAVPARGRDGKAFGGLCERVLGRPDLSADSWFSTNGDALRTGTTSSRSSWRPFGGRARRGSRAASPPGSPPVRWRRPRGDTVVEANTLFDPRGHRNGRTVPTIRPPLSSKDL